MLLRSRPGTAFVELLAGARFREHDHDAIVLASDSPLTHQFEEAGRGPAGNLEIAFRSGNADRPDIGAADMPVAADQW